MKMIITAKALKEWLAEDKELAFLMPEVFTGKGTKGGYSGQSDMEQREILEKFRQGQCKILVSTSVGEEGLDFPDCNISIRYNHETNEISMVQASGRARAKESESLLIGGEKVLLKQQLNLELEQQLQKAIANLDDMDPDGFKAAIIREQQVLLVERESNELRQKNFQESHAAESVEFYCKGCSKFVCHKGHIRKYYSHYIIPGKLFWDMLYVEREDNVPKFGVMYVIYCKNCSQIWGGLFQDKYPSIGLKNFKVKIAGTEKRVKKWTKVPGEIDDFNPLADTAIINLADYLRD